ncbi:MAG: 5'-3' exonuclease H3TH domain-containing protein [Planctomycetota bacterium]|nr:5'-3' exonuclease H3TH domain-containing protein [Planctomycetota bacterium]
MKIHLIDGTYELFRQYFGAPDAMAFKGKDVGATRGLMRTLLKLLREDATHVAVAFDQVIESFRNELFDGYKTGEGMPAELWEQFPLAEEGSEALGLVTWKMVEFEADDALSTAAARWRDHKDVEQVVIGTPDKDLGQCVRGDDVVLLDRRRKIVLNEAGIKEKFGVLPASIADYLALVGDAADGIPGVPRWGAKSTATVLSRYGHIEQIPQDPDTWDIKVRGKAGLSKSLEAERENAALYKTLATLRLDVPLKETLEDLEWKGADKEKMSAFCAKIGDSSLMERVHLWKP